MKTTCLTEFIMDPLSERTESKTLQDLPVEMLDHILMKTVLMSLSRWIQRKPVSKDIVPLILSPLMTVWSEWNVRLLVRWVRITLKSRIRSIDNLLPANPTIVSRSDWNAREPNSRAVMAEPVLRVIVHHSVQPQAFDEDSCLSAVQRIQNYHMDINGWSDIGYNFLVGEDGRVYEGRGWKVVGAHTLYFNDTSVGICVVGDFAQRSPNDAALKALQEIIRLGVKEGHIDSDYTLHGHQDLRAGSESPGRCLYSIIQNWTHYQSIKN